MAPLHPQRRSGKGSGQQSIKTPTSTEQRSSKPKSNSDYSQAASSNRKSSKRKIHDTTDCKDNGTVSSHAGSEGNIPNLPSTSSRAQSNSTWQFRAQSTNAEIEKDCPCVTNVGAHHSNQWSNTGLEAKGSRSNNSLANQEGLIDSTYSFDENERTLIRIASYVINISPEDVKECMLFLKRQGEQITKENLLDECLKHTGSRSGHTFVSQNFPQQNLSNGASGIAKTSLCDPELPARTTSASVQNASAPLPGASSVQHQVTKCVRKGAPKEDQVDGSVSSSPNLPNSQHVTNSSTKSTRKTDNPSAVYHSRVNNVVSHSSAKHVSSSRDSPVDPSKSAKAKTQDAPQQKTGYSQTADGSNGQELTRSESSSSHNSLTTAADSTAASIGAHAQNDLNKESSQVGHSEAVPSFHQSLKEVDPAEYLATCLKLVRDEHRRLDSARHCGQCGSKPRDITFLPCGHVWACRSCAGPLYVCPCCNKNIIATVDTYLC